MTTFTDVFGADTIPPAGMSFQALSLTGNVSTSWPYNSTGGTAIAKINDLTATGAWTITMPPATQVSNGEDVLFRNTSAFTVQLLKNTGSALATVAAGTAVYIYVTDNTTQDGLWGIVDFGSSSSTVSAAALAGYGLVTAGSLLNTTVATFTLTGAATISSTHWAALVNYTSGAGAVSLTNPATLGAGFYCLFHNSSAATATLTPAAGTIDAGVAFQVQPGESLILICSGTDFVTVGYGRSTSYQFTQQVINVTAAAYTLTAPQASAKLLKFTGNQTGIPVITIPGTAAVYYIINAMIAPSAQLSFTTGVGTTTSVPINTSSTILCDGTDVTSATTSASYTATTISLADGTAASPALSFTSDTDTGIYRSAANILSIATNGAAVADFTTTGVAIAGLTASSAVATNASKTLVSVANTGTGNNVLETNPTISGPVIAGHPTIEGVTSTGATGTGALVFATNPTLAGITDSGNLDFTGTGNRITGDFSNATVANRVAFQTSTVNGATDLLMAPNGSSTISGVFAVSGLTANESLAQFRMVGGTAVQINSAITGTGTYLPMTFYTGGAERLRIDTSGNVGIGRTPTRTLDIYTGSAADSGLRCANTVGTAGVDFYCGSDGSAYIYQRNNNAMIFGTNNIERLRIGTSGELGIAGANYGTSGQVLTSGGAGAAPSWVTGLALSSFTGSNQSLAASGYQKLPGGLIIQWGTATSSGTTAGNITATYPTAFPNATLWRGAVPSSSSGQNQIINTHATVTTSAATFTAVNASTAAITTGISCYWLAIGY